MEVVQEESDRITHYPLRLKSDFNQSQSFNKQFTEIIDRALKKILEPINFLESLQSLYAKCATLKDKKTLVISLDDCLIKTSLFKEDLP
jgi:hypothetical protein